MVPEMIVHKNIVKLSVSQNIVMLRAFVSFSNAGST